MRIAYQCLRPIHLEPASSGRPYVVATLVGLAMVALSFAMQPTDVVALGVISWILVWLALATHLGVVIRSVKFWRAHRKRDVGAMVLALIISIAIAFLLIIGLVVPLVLYLIVGILYLIKYGT